MSVLACVRNGCYNVMCHTHITGIGYICEECKAEFKQYASDKPLRSWDDIEIELSNFMDTYKGSYDSNKNDLIDDFFGENEMDYPLC